jgi:hypothetical protein
MLSGRQVALHARSFRILTRRVRTQARYEYIPREEPDESSFTKPAGLATPRQVCFLNFIPVGFSAGNTHDYRDASSCNTSMNS